ncbi:hypothetical protein, partial [Kocuria rhizophila]|uniref:hypothetical protein n=1 Tax=Kocuria rhizophila TaxID=72000 RepID=UPI001C92BC07
MGEGEVGELMDGRVWVEWDLGGGEEGGVGGDMGEGVKGEGEIGQGKLKEMEGVRWEEGGGGVYVLGKV